MYHFRDRDLVASSQASKWAEQLLQLQIRLRNKSEDDRNKAARSLARYVAAQSRELSNETFAKFMEDLNGRLHELLTGASSTEKLGGVAAIEALIDVDHVTQWMASALQQLFNHKDVSVITAATTVLGKFARVKGTMLSEFLETQLRQAMEWLSDPRVVNPHVALLILGQLAANAPSLFYIQASNFLENVWNGLTHKDKTIRSAAAAALKEALAVLSLRDSNNNLHQQWYNKLFTRANEHLPRSPSVEAIHGSLLAVTELLLNVSAFMQPRFRQVCDSVVKCYNGNNNKMIRQTIISMLAILAHCQASDFAIFYLNPIMTTILLAAWKKETDKSNILITIGGISLATGSAMKPFLDEIMKHIKYALGPKKSSPSLAAEALSCLAMLASALQSDLSPYVQNILDLIFAQPLSPTLVETLSALADHIPALAVGVQVRLMDMISHILDGKAFKFPGAPSKLYYSSRKSTGAGGSVPATPPPSHLHAEDNPQIITLALRTLGSFSFSKAFLSEFLRKVVVKYLNHNSPAVRQEAVVTSAQLTISMIAGTQYQQQSASHHSTDSIILGSGPHYTATTSSNISHSTPQITVNTRGHSAQVANEILSKLLNVAVTDSDPLIRLTVLDSLDPSFDVFLAQADFLHLLFLALNDEQFDIRSASIHVVCRLVSRNPAYVLPALRKKLLQLLSELQYSEDGLGKEQSALALSQLVYGSKRLAQPYSPSIFNALIELVTDQDTRVAAQVMEALGQLARVSNLSAHIDTLLPIIIDTLQDQSSQSKRRAALETLGHLVQSTGYVITPLLKYPKLLDMCTNIIKTEQSYSDMKYQVIKVLGILGALDPDKQRQSALRLQKKRRALASAALNLDNTQANVDPNAQQPAPLPTGDAAPPNTGAEAEAAPQPTGDPAATEVDSALTLNPSSEEYYPTCAVNALLGILRDPSLGMHHQSAVQAIMYMFKSLGLRCVPFLTQIMPSILHILKTCEARFKEFLFQQLAVLVSIVKQHIRDYLTDIFKLIKEFWNGNMLFNIATLIEEIAVALNDEFRTYMPIVMPLILSVFHSEQTGSRRKTIRLSQTLEVFGTLLDDYQHVVLPSLVKLFEMEHPDADLDVAVAAIRCVGRLSTKLPIHDFAARIIHPLLRAMDPAADGFMNISTDHPVGLAKEFGAAPSPLASTVADLRPSASMRDLSSVATTTSPTGLSDTSGMTEEEMVAQLSTLGLGTSQTFADLVQASLHTLCLFMCQLRQEYQKFIPAVRRVLSRLKIPTANYDDMEKLLTDAFSSTQNASTSQTLFEEKVAALLLREEYTSSNAVFRLQSHETVASSKLKVNEQTLSRAWDTSKRSTKEDWAEWIRKFSVELLRESPSPALRSCLYVADYLPVVRTLFNASFVSCWNELSLDHQDQLIRSLETALTSPNIPPEILQYLLDLAEFMEHVNTKFPMDKHKLGVMAEKCHAYAKALYYKEIEFKHKPDNINTIESLISINNKLGLPHAANGILKVAQLKNQIQLRDSWYEKLGNWDEALKSYTKRASTDREGLLGRMRCLNALGEWETILVECWPYYQLEQLQTASTGASGSSFASAITPSATSFNLRHSGAWLPGVAGSASAPSSLAFLGSGSSRPHSLHMSSNTIAEFSGSNSSGSPHDSFSNIHNAISSAISSPANSVAGIASASISSKSLLSPQTQLPPADSELQKLLAPLACSAAWYLQDWEKLQRFVLLMDPSHPDGAFYRAVLHLHFDEFDMAQRYINLSRQLLDTELTALFSESYQRAYTSLVHVQQLSELEELISYRQGDIEQKTILKRIWSQRLKGCQRDLDVWRRLLAVRAMVIPPQHDLDPWLEFASLARKSGRLRLAHKILNQLAEPSSAFTVPQLQINQLRHVSPGGAQPVQIPGGPSIVKHQAVMASNNNVSVAQNDQLVAINNMVVSPRSHDPDTLSSRNSGDSPTLIRAKREVNPPELVITRSSSSISAAEPTVKSSDSISLFASSSSLNMSSLNMSSSSLMDAESQKEVPAQPVRIDLSRVRFAQIKQQWAEGNKEHAQQLLRRFAKMVPSTDQNLLARVAYTTGSWIQFSHEQLDESVTIAIINEYRNATKADPSWYKAWHALALINYETVQKIRKEGRTQPSTTEGKISGSVQRSIGLAPEILKNYLIPAISGFFRSIALNPGQNLQDILRLLTLWFDFGQDKSVETALQEGFKNLSIDVWLPVIPQIIARIHAPAQPVRRLLQELLTSIGKEHPQALVYALTVASKSQSHDRLTAAQNIIEKMRTHSATLVDQAALVSNELIRVAILWHEMWYDGLEEASRQYFGERNVEAMLQTLDPLHKMMQKGAETVREMNFQTNFRRELDDAAEWCKKYVISKNEADMTHAWDLYYHVFRKINKLPQMAVLELKNVSPKLLTAHNMDLAVPGTYKANKPVTRILKFHPVLKIITSKQRPRKLNIVGSDGIEYYFLLKGREDLRQDERVMQLFGLVNALLRKNARSRVSLGSIVDLSIQPYSVIPLSPVTGLLGWVPHTDTLHQLIREYRQSRNVALNIEHRFVLRLASDYDNLTLMQKVEVFEHALEASDGMDLERVLWLKSPNSEVWLERRTNFTTSLAVMSMVGYILGLGDRHPSNLMLDRHTGKIIHIDFGDCFEVAMHREKYPEKVPFRLTRMLVNAMDVSGIEGNFRTICEVVMTVLRENKESLMAVLEAFVHDPLINWRLLNNPSPTRKDAPSTNSTASASVRATVKQPTAGPGSSSEDLYSPAAPPEPAYPTNSSIRSLVSTIDAEGIPRPDQLNERALVVITRVSDKLSGRDFDKNQRLPVAEQVQKLIKMATSRENLCQAYLGWVGHW